MSINKIQNEYVESFLTQEQKAKLPSWRELQRQAVNARHTYEEEQSLDLLGLDELSENESDLVRARYAEYAPKADNKKEAVVIVGPMGAGKTTSMYEQEGNFLHLSQDNFIPQMHGFNDGFATTALFKRAGAMNAEMHRLAAKDGKRVIMERTGRPGSFEALTEQLDVMCNTYGYRVKIVYVHVSKEIAVQRAMNRFEQACEEGDVQNMRFVDPVEVYDIANKLEGPDIINRLCEKYAEFVDGYEIYDNTGVERELRLSSDIAMNEDVAHLSAA